MQEQDNATRNDWASVDTPTLLEAAELSGVRVFMDGGRLTQVCGMWWTQDLMDAIWEREDEVVATLTGSAVFSSAELARLEFHRWRFRGIPAADRPTTMRAA